MKDEEREERIAMETIVDAYDPEEQAMGWYTYLSESLQFPFYRSMYDAKSHFPAGTRRRSGSHGYSASRGMRA